MTVHTFEVSSMLDNKRFYNIQKQLTFSDKSKWRDIKKEGMQYWGLSDKGIKINMYRIKKEGYYSYCITYVISARRVMENDNFLGLFNTDDYPKLEKKVNKILKKKCELLPKLKECKLKRLDFCINAALENQEQVKAYIKTAKRANVPSKLEVYEQYDKKSKRKKPTKDDYTVYASEYVTVSIYNKYMEMKKQKDGAFPPGEIERARNIVRIEIRCMEGKIRELKKKYDINTISDFMLYGDKIGDELYNYYLSRIFNNGAIYTLKEALERIDSGGYKPKNTELLKEFVKFANELRSVAKACRNITGREQII